MNEQNNFWKFLSIFFLGLIVGFSFNKIIGLFEVNQVNLGYCQDLAKCQGNKNAKVTIVEYSDFQCPFCKQYFDESYKKLKADYVDTNKVYYVFKDYPLPSHPQAPKAAEAANCAAEQNKFWEMHDLLFENQSQWSGKPDNIATFKKFAGDLKLDQQKFDQCLDSGKHQAIVENERSEGISKQVSGTPTFFINGQKLVGAHDYETSIKTTIEEALKSAK
jgi:protein-disulfide isomerase